jgi:hypothetical protein
MALIDTRYPFKPFSRRLQLTYSEHSIDVARSHAKRNGIFAVTTRRTNDKNAGWENCTYHGRQ